MASPSRNPDGRAGSSPRRRRFLGLADSPDPARDAGGATGRSALPEPAGGGGDAAEPPLSERTRALLRALPVAALWVDAANALVWAHPALAAMRIVGRGSVQVASVAALIDQARLDGAPVVQEVTIRRPGRRAGQIEARVAAHPMPDGAVLAMIEDISEAQRLDHVRRDFVANVSHELKTPVGALSLLAEAITQAHGDGAAVAHFARLMQAEASRLTSLINDLMDLSRIEGMDRAPLQEPVSVDDVVEQALADAAVAATAKNIQVLRGGIPGLYVLGVEGQLVTAVRNLIVNAVNYSPEGTRVAVTTGSAEGMTTIAVTDQGIGISPDELDRIFERFYRVDPARSRSTGGTGLGLAIVKHVCANHGGSCEVWSRVGAGSTFTMLLPELTPTQLKRITKRGRGRPAREGS